MPYRLDELARLVGGECTGDGAIEITGTATLREAKVGDISLADRPELARQLAGASLSAVVVSANFKPDNVASITVSDVHRAFAAIVRLFHPPRTMPYVGISPQAIVSATARVDSSASVHPLAVIGDDVEIGPRTVVHGGVHIMAGCRIGEDVEIFPRAVLYENTVVGARCIIHAGAVLGAYGFGYHFQQGRHVLSSQLGYVELGADVDIGANATVDRGTYGPTTIGEGTKIDNQVQIAHNCRLGKHNLVCSQVGVAGSCTTGDYVVMAGQVGVADHVDIGDKAVLGAKAGVHNHVPASTTMLGVPALPISEQRRMMAAYTKLPEMRSQIRELQRALEQLTGPKQDKNAA